MENPNAVLELDILLTAETGSRPKLESFDSGQEFSLTRLLEIYRLVQMEDHELDGFLFNEFSDYCESGR